MQAMLTYWMVFSEPFLYHFELYCTIMNLGEIHFIICHNAAAYTSFFLLSTKVDEVWKFLKETYDHNR